MKEIIGFIDSLIEFGQSIKEMIEEIDDKDKKINNKYPNKVKVKIDNIKTGGFSSEVYFTVKNNLGQDIACLTDKEIVNKEEKYVTATFIKAKGIDRTYISLPDNSEHSSVTILINNERIIM